MTPCVDLLKQTSPSILPSSQLERARILEAIFSSIFTKFYMYISLYRKVGRIFIDVWYGDDWTIMSNI